MGENKNDKESFEAGLTRLLLGANAGRRSAIFIAVLLIAVFVISNMQLLGSININLNQSGEAPESSASGDTSSDADSTELDTPDSSYRFAITSFDWLGKDVGFPTHLEMKLALSRYDAAKTVQARLVFPQDVLLDFSTSPSTIIAEIVKHQNEEVLVLTGHKMVDSDSMNLYALISRPQINRVELRATTPTGAIFSDVIYQKELLDRYSGDSNKPARPIWETIGLVFVWTFVIA